MENINYNNDILIYPITGNLSDITNNDITSNYAININILSLVNSTGLAVYYNNNQIYKDFNNDIENKQILNDYTNVDMTVYSYNIYNIYLESSSLIKAYLYDNNRKKISNIFQKNINIDYKVNIDYINIDLLNKDNYSLDGTISITGNLYDTIYLKNISGIFNNYYQLESNTNIYEITTSDNTNLIYNLYQDENKLHNINNNITLYTLHNNKQSSPKFKNNFYVKHKNCQAPLLNPTIQEEAGYYTYYANPTTTYIGTQENCCIYSKYLNLSIQPFAINQKNSNYFSLYNNYLTTSSIQLYYNTPLLIKGTLNQGNNQNSEISGDLDTTTVSTYTNDKFNLYNNFNLIDYDDSSLFLQFKSYHDLKFLSNNQTNIRIKNKYNNLYSIIYQYNTYDTNLILFDDYTNTSYGEFNYTGPDFYTTSNFIEQAKYNLKYNNQNSGTNSVIINSSQKQKYGGSQKYYQNSDKLPIMLRVVTNHKVNMRLSMIGASTYFPNNYTNLINTTILPNEPFELKQSDNFYIIPYSYSNYAEFYFELLDTTTIDSNTAQDIEFNVQLTPIKDDRLYLVKSDINLNINDEIEYFSIEGGIYENTNYMYNISSINNFILNNNYIYANKPFIKFDKGYLDLSILITELTSNDETSLFNLYFKVYLNDNTSISDYTIINNLSIGDIVHVYNFDLNKEYIVEAYINSDNTNILNSEIEKFIFRTPSGVCSTPTVIRDQLTGHQTITCLGNCKPSYTYVTSYYPDGNTMHNIYYQDGLNSAYGEPNEQLVTHPYTNRPCNMFLDNTTVDICIAPYTIRYATELAGVFFAFSCISNDLSYASSEVIESENYPSQTMCPVGNLLYNYRGSSSWRQYEHDYARGTGSHYTYRYYRINGGSQISGGTNSYYNITMNIGYEIEIKQTDSYNNFNNSQTIKRKRWA